MTLIERADEFAVAHQAVHRLGAGHSAAVIIHSGPGTGRTALLEAGLAAARHAGLTVASAQASAIEGDLRYGVVGRLLEALPDDLVPAHARTPDVGPDDPIGPCSALLAAARGRPLVLAVDDAHWIDRESGRVLRMLLDRVHHAPLLVVLTTTHPHGPLADVAAAGPDSVTVLRPAPLSEAGVRLLCQDVFAVRPDPRFAREAGAATGGNPGVLVPALREFARAGGRPCATMAARFAAVAAEHRAEQVARVLAGLPGDALDLLRAVAVTAGDLEYRLVAAMVGTQRGALDRVRDSGLVVGGDRLRPADAVTRERVLAGMTTRERRTLHAEAAELAHRTAASDEVVGRILLGARPVGAAWAPRVLRQAAQRARLAGRDLDAVALLECALGDTVLPVDRADLLIDLAAAVVGDRPEAGDRALTGVVGIGDGPGLDTRRLRAADRLLGRGACTATRRAVTGRLAALAARDAADSPAVRLERDALAALHALAVDLGPDAAHPSADRVPELPDTPLDAVAAGVAAWRLAVRGVDLERTRMLAKAALAASSDEQPLAMPRIAACGALELADDVEEAEAGLAAVLTDARARGVRVIAAAALRRLGGLALRRGRLDEAAHHLAAAQEELSTDAWDPVMRPFVPACQALVDLERGHIDEAERRVTVDLPAAAERGLGWTYLLYARGAVYLAMGKPAAARQELVECGRRLTGRQWDNPGLLRWRHLAAEALCVLGETVAARTLLAQDQRAAAAWGSASVAGATDLVGGVLLDGADGIGTGRIARAERTLRDAPPRLLYAHCLVALADVKREQGAAAEAVLLLERAAHSARVLGARALAGQADVLLRRAADEAAKRPGGGQARIGPHAGLSAAESRVADLAASGLSNPAIADTLAVTRRTVELHLSSAYRKLAVADRTELAALLVSRDRPDRPRAARPGD
ncbi:AAA family ATPase [Actinokineospora sp.]|uniref:AAA family ATPase n=1 Tax=Actinokineospora sp. TaxID=1872133 RepID=UPI00403764B8